eukprot:6172003-Pleurochrysis_carterae.AAC.1
MNWTIRSHVFSVENSTNTFSPQLQANTIEGFVNSCPLKGAAERAITVRMPSTSPEPQVVTRGAGGSDICEQLPRGRSIIWPPPATNSAGEFVLYSDNFKLSRSQQQNRCASSLHAGWMKHRLQNESVALTGM